MTLPNLVVEYALRLMVLVSVVAIGLTLIRPALARTRLFVWALVLCAAWVMPVLRALLPEVPVALLSVFAMPDVVIASGAASSFALMGSAMSPGIESPAGTAASLPSLVVLVYFCGAGLLLVRLAWGWRLTHALMRSAREVADADLCGLAERHAERLGLRSAPALLESELVRVPFACGIWRPRVVLPETWRSWDSSTRDAVLVHELSHIARRDLWTLRAAALYRALTWMNPASWWLRRRLEVLTESASDESVLAAGIDRQAYAELLLRFMAAGQRTAGRAAWHLAMARTGDADAEQRIAQVLEWRGGADMALTFAKKVMIAAGIVAAGVPAVVLTAGQKESATVVTAPVLRYDIATAQGRSAVNFEFTPAPAGAPASIVSMTMTIEPGVTTKLSVKNNSTQTIRAVTFQVLVTSAVKPSAFGRVLTGEPIATSIAPGKTVEIASGLLDMKSAAALATDGPITATFSVQHVEFANGVTAPVAPQVQAARAVTVPASQEPYVSDAPGIVAPIVTHRSHPKYTSEAMRAKLQGQVEMKVVVESDGTVGDVEVTRSLDTAYGLDFEAVRAVKEWRFIPGTLNGNPVATWVVVVLDFRLH